MDIYAAIPTLLGVVLGFCLSQGTDWVTGFKRRRKVRFAIESELRSLYNQIPQYIEIINHCISALKTSRVLPGECLPPKNNIYVALTSELPAILNIKDLNILHVIYSTVSLAHDFLCSSETRLKSDIREGIVDRPYDTYVHKFGDLVKALERTKYLINSFLKGSPIDVFSIDESSSTTAKIK